MKIHLVLSCWLLSAVCVQVSAVIQASGVVGGEAMIECPKANPWFLTKYYNKYFCKDQCSYKVVKAGSSGISTTGRYSIFDKRDDGSFTVTITGLKMSDSGKYWCGVEMLILKDSRQEVYLTVKDAPPKPSIPRPAVPTTTSNVPTTPYNLSTTSDNLSTTSDNLSTTSQASGDLSGASSRPGVVTYASVGLVVMVTVLGLALLGFYRKRRGGNRKSAESSDGLDNPAAGQDDRVYEDVREEDRQSDSLPAVVMYGNVSFPNDAKDPTYSTVTFTKGGAAPVFYSTVTHDDSRTRTTVSSSHGTPDDLVYSLAQLPKDV